MSIGYIVENERYPEWIRTHSVFKSFNKIDKIFPSIGLDNFTKDIVIDNPLEALNCASSVISRIYSEATLAIEKLYNHLYLNKDDENIKHIQNICFFINNYILSLPQSPSIENDKVVIKHHSSVSDFDKVVIQPGTSVFKSYNKLYGFVTKFATICKLENMEEFKEFSKINLPNKNYKLTFSSTGEDGAWDIATMSERGIKSCMSWNNPQSHGLIGSIVSKFVGIIYISSANSENKMLYRSLVRFCIDKNTKKPFVFVDKIYPSENVEVKNHFFKALQERTDLDILDVSSIKLGNFSLEIPDEPYKQYVKKNELSYMDFKIDQRVKTIDQQKEMERFLDKIGKFANQLFLKVKKEVYISKFESKTSKNIKNLIEYISKDNKDDNPIITAFVKASIEDLFIIPKQKPENKLTNQYYREYLYFLIENFKQYQKDSFNKISNSKFPWNNDFPKSSVLLLKMIHSVVSKFLYEETYSVSKEVL